MTDSEPKPILYCLNKGRRSNSRSGLTLYDEFNHRCVAPVPESKKKKTYNNNLSCRMRYSQVVSMGGYVPSTPSYKLKPSGIGGCIFRYY
jgi:hypothetical protein